MPQRATQSHRRQRSGAAGRWGGTNSGIAGCASKPRARRLVKIRRSVNLTPAPTKRHVGPFVRTGGRVGRRQANCRGLTPAPTKGNVGPFVRTGGGWTSRDQLPRSHARAYEGQRRPVRENGGGVDVARPTAAASRPRLRVRHLDASWIIRRMSWALPKSTRTSSTWKQRLGSGTPRTFWIGC